MAAPSKTLERRGRGGHSRLTTPSALSKELRDIFLMRSHPSYPRRGLIQPTEVWVEPFGVTTSKANGGFTSGGNSAQS